MNEKEVESHFKKRVKELGGKSYKWVSPGHASVEDQIAFFPLGELWVVEMKRPGELPTDAQWREIMRHRNRGHNAGYLSSISEVDEFIFSGDREEWMRQHVQKCPEEWRNRL